MLCKVKESDSIYTLQLTYCHPPFYYLDANTQSYDLVEYFLTIYFLVFLGACLLLMRLLELQDVNANVINKIITSINFLSFMIMFLKVSIKYNNKRYLLRVMDCCPHLIPSVWYLLLNSRCYENIYRHLFLTSFFGFLKLVYTICTVKIIIVLCLNYNSTFTWYLIEYFYSNRVKD